MQTSAALSGELILAEDLTDGAMRLSALFDDCPQCTPDVRFTASQWKSSSGSECKDVSCTDVGCPDDAGIAA